MQLRLKQWFDPILISAEVGYRKPDSRIFRMVLEAWNPSSGAGAEDGKSDAGGGGSGSGGGVHRHQVVMVGDRTSRDIVGARRIGMRPVLCVLNAKQEDAYAKTVVRSRLPSRVR